MRWEWVRRLGKQKRTTEGKRFAIAGCGVCSCQFTDTWARMEGEERELGWRVHIITHSWTVCVCHPERGDKEKRKAVCWFYQKYCVTTRCLSPQYNLSNVASSLTKCHKITWYCSKDFWRQQSFLLSPKSRSVILLWDQYSRNSKILWLGTCA